MVAKTCPEALKLLWEEGVFKTPQPLAVVIKELSTRRYNFTKQAVSMALPSIDFLTKQGNPGNYTFVEKYPPE